MKIIKHGKTIDPAKEFCCNNCGCIFIAESGEYSRVPMQYNEMGYESECPECRTVTYKSEYERDTYE